jgi:hypothetical protein
LVNGIFAHVKAFEVKLRLWEIQLTKQNTAHFPTLNARTQSVSFNAKQQSMQLKLVF